MHGVPWGILMSEWYSVSQGDDALGTEQQVITPNRGHNGRCKYDSTAKSKAQNTTNHFSLIYILQALVFTYPDDIYDLFASILLRNGQWAQPSLNFSLFRIVSSVRSSNSHPDLLVIQHHHPTFSDHTGPQHWTFTF